MSWLLEPAIFPWAALITGLCVGSFLNVVIYRLPLVMEREWFSQMPEVLEESPRLRDRPEAKRVAAEVRSLVRPFVEGRFGLGSPRSLCPGCRAPIPLWRNIPLLSFVLQRGRCAACGFAIGLRYPVVELLAGIGTMYCAWRFGGAPVAAIGAAVFLWAVIALAFIDQETGFLPDDITLPLVWLGLLFNWKGTFVPLDQALVGAVAGYMVLWSINALFKAVRGMDGMGQGDFKMTAAVGAFVGWIDLFMVVFLSSLVGLVFGSLQMFAARRGWDWKFKFHFGPYIAIAGLIALLWGSELAGRYPVLRLKLY